MKYVFIILFLLFNIDNAYASSNLVQININRLHKPTNIEIKGFTFINLNNVSDYTLEDDSVLNVGDIQSSINLKFEKDSDIINITVVEFDENKKLKIEKEILNFNKSNIIDHYIDTEYNKYKIKIER